MPETRNEGLPVSIADRRGACVDKAGTGRVEGRKERSELNEVRRLAGLNQGDIQTAVHDR
jgi:hypothetical protein